MNWWVFRNTLILFITHIASSWTSGKNEQNTIIFTSFPPASGWCFVASPCFVPLPEAGPILCSLRQAFPGILTKVLCRWHLTGVEKLQLLAWNTVSTTCLGWLVILSSSFGCCFWAARHCVLLLILISCAWRPYNNLLLIPKAYWNPHGILTITPTVLSANLLVSSAGTQTRTWFTGWVLVTLALEANFLEALNIAQTWPTLTCQATILQDQSLPISHGNCHM